MGWREICEEYTEDYVDPSPRVVDFGSVAMIVILLYVDEK